MIVRSTWRGYPDDEIDGELMRQAKAAGALAIRFYFVLRLADTAGGEMMPHAFSPYFYTLARASAEVDDLRPEHGHLAVASIVHFYCPDDPREFSEWEAHRAAQEMEAREWHH